MKTILSASLLASFVLAVSQALPGEAQGARGVAQPPAAVDQKVAPGLVPWHADLAECKRAAALSGKPILVFQLLGLLDERLC